MVPFAGFDMPVQYQGVKAEHLATRGSAGLFDVSHMGEVRVRGAGAEDALMWLLSNAIRRLKPGAAQYNAMCNHDGGVVDDVFVYRLAADDFLVCVNAANREKDFQWMTTHDRTGTPMVDEGDQWAQLAVQGPAAEAVMVDVVGDWVTDLGRHRFRRAEVLGVADVLVARTGYTGEDGFELFLPMAGQEREVADVWPALVAAGAPHGLVPVGLGARDTLRLEAGNCLYGNELDDETTPLQAGLGWITKLRKPGGFIGSDAIERRRHEEHPVLVGFRVDGKRIARQGMAVRMGDRHVGTVTSGTLGPSVGAPIGMAYVHPDAAADNTELIIDVRGRPAPAHVVPTPFLRGS